MSTLLSSNSSSTPFTFIATDLDSLPVALCAAKPPVHTEHDNTGQPVRESLVVAIVMRGFGQPLCPGCFLSCTRSSTSEPILSRSDELSISLSIICRELLSEFTSVSELYSGAAWPTISRPESSEVEGGLVPGSSLCPLLLFSRVSVRNRHDTVELI